MPGIMTNEGKEYAFADRFRVGQDYTLHIYTNSVSLTKDVVLADFVELVSVGYSSKTLTGGNWNIATDVSNVTSATYAEQTFSFDTASFEGYYIIDPTGTYVVYAESFGGTQTNSAVNITPVIKSE